MNNFVNTSPYLRTSREFPDDINEISVALNKSYVDIAETINDRTIGIFAKNRPAINGESWFLTSQKQTGIRQVFTYDSTGSKSHGLDFDNIYSITKATGVAYDSSSGNYYGLIFGSDTAITAQYSFYLTPTTIEILSGAGVPSVTNFLIVLEWISNV